MELTDYACPNCRRVRRRQSDKDSLVFRCSCVGGLIECPRVRWDLADWKMLDQPLADALGVGRHNVAAKRTELGKPRGTVGRKPHKAVRRIDASKIDPKKTLAANARLLGCSAERIRQLIKEMFQ